MKDHATTKDGCLIVVYSDYDGDGERFEYDPSYEQGIPEIEQTWPDLRHYANVRIADDYGKGYIDEDRGDAIRFAKKATTAKRKYVNIFKNLTQGGFQFYSLTPNDYYKWHKTYPTVEEAEDALYAIEGKGDNCEPS